MTTTNSNGPEMVVTPRVRESGAVGGAIPIVPQPSDNAQQGLHSVDPDPADVLRDYWATAKRHYQRGDYVDYGSDDWKALPIDDPRKMAGLVAFAELWRRYNPEIAEDFNRQLRTTEPLWQRATDEACTTAVRQILARQQHRREAA